MTPEHVVYSRFMSHNTASTHLRQGCLEWRRVEGRIAGHGEAGSWQCPSRSSMGGGGV